jgi:hypothetical protein
MREAAERKIRAEASVASGSFNDGRPIYFDSIDNSAYILGQARHSARRSWVHIDGENFLGARTEVAGDPANPDLNIG